MVWPWQKTETRSTQSIANPAVAALFGAGPSTSGVSVNEKSSLGLSAFFRAGSLISGTIGTLPLRTLHEKDGQRTRVKSFLDDPGGSADGGPTPFEWVETVLWHLVTHGNAYLAHVYNGAGALYALTPIHPLAVEVEWDPDRPGRKMFTATLIDGRRQVFNDDTMTHIPSVSLDGLKGLSLIGIARNSLGIAIAGDRSAGRMFGQGPMISGLITPEVDIDAGELKEMMSELNGLITGVENAGKIAALNRKLKFTQWASSNADAQWLESRQFQIEEISRWTGVPPFALMQTDKQTSWGTGIEAQQRGLARTVLAVWTTRVEQRLARLLPGPRWCEFDFAGLERATPEQEIRLLIEQIRGGLITVEEARMIRNLPPEPELGTLVPAGPADAAPAPIQEDMP